MKRGLIILLALALIILSIFYLNLKKEDIGLAPSTSLFIINNTLAPAGASLNGSNLAGFDSLLGVYYFEFRNSSNTLLTRYEINVNDLNVQKGLIQIKENLTNSYPIYAGGTIYRNLAGGNLFPWTLSQSASISYSSNFVNNILSINYTETYQGVTTKKQFDFQIKGKTLVIHAFAIEPNLSAKGNYMGFSFDRSEYTPNPKNISLTYAETAPIVIAGNPGDRYFYSTYPDWTKSNSNDWPWSAYYWSSPTSLSASLSPIYKEGQINPLTGFSNYPPLDETLYLTVSRDIEDTIMKVNRLPSIWRADLSSRPVIDIWSLAQVNIIPAGSYGYGKLDLLMQTFNSYGLENYILLSHYVSRYGTTPGFSSNPATMCGGELPNVYPSNVIPGSLTNLDLGFYPLIDTVKSSGSLIAIMQDIGTMYQSSAVWNESSIKRNSSGWSDQDWPDPNCNLNYYGNLNPSLNIGLQPYTMAMDKMADHAINESFFMKRDYNLTAIYTDVTTKRWFTKFIDYSYKNNKSMTTAQAVANIIPIHDAMRNIYDGPLLGEGGGGFTYDRWIAGHTDGVEAEISFGKKNTPVLPQFELIHIKPLMANQGMGYPNRYEPRNTPVINQQEGEAIINIGNSNKTYTINGTNFTVAPFDFDRWHADTIIYGHTGIATDHFLYGDPFLWDIWNGLVPYNDPRLSEYLLDFQKYFVKEYYLFKDLQNQYLSSNVVEILYKTPVNTMVSLGLALDEGVDFMNAQIYERYENGLEVYVNRNQNANWIVNVGGQNYYLPPNGWVAINAVDFQHTFLSYSGLVDQNGIPAINGHRVDIVRRVDFSSSGAPLLNSSYVFVDSRGNLTDFSGWVGIVPLVTDHMNVVKADGWNLEEISGNPFFRFAPSGPSNYNITTENMQGSINLGGLIQVPIKISSINGPNRQVSLLVSGVPLGATATINPIGCMIPCTPNNPVLTINTSGMTSSPGIYSIIISGTSGSLYRDNSANPFLLTVNSGTSTGGPGGPTGSGSGSGGPGSLPPSLPQCSDNMDNDNDLKIDFPADLGCTYAGDNFEFDSVIEVDSDEQPGDEIHGSSEKDIEVRVFFWLIIIVLILGIIVAGIVILRSIRQHNRFKELSYISNSNQLN